jgi:membrane-bound lytic murein transglycosylase A
MATRLLASARLLVAACFWAGCFVGAAAGPCVAEGRGFSLEPLALGDLPGFSEDHVGEALKLWRATCGRAPHASQNLPELRIDAWNKACAAAKSAKDAPTFFKERFRAFRVAPDGAPDSFFTGYYQPEIPGALTPTQDFAIPAYGLPSDLVATSQIAGLTAARRGSDGALAPYPDRAAIEDGALESGAGARKLVYLRDRADLFLAQVQGSARVRLADGRVFHLAFAGRNGQPYTAIARILVQRGVATPADMTMPKLIAWLRDNGLRKGEAGDELLRQNRSFVFFEGHFDRTPDAQPQGASGAALTPLRSIAVDRKFWPYGLPFFIDAELPWRGPDPEPFRRVMIAQDTGSAIVGPGRADIYFGLGDGAGARAGALRHHGQFYLLLPRE